MQTPEVQNECPYGTAQYNVKPKVEEQLESIKRNPERLRDLKPINQETEDALARHELNEYSVQKFQFAMQEELLDEKARLVNILHFTGFLQRLQTIPGLHGYYGWSGQGKELGLFVHMRGQERRLFRGDLPLGVQYICFVQAPYMPEWSVIRLDEYHLPVNEKYRGWRTVLMRLIAAGAITEQEAHAVFGNPPETAVSRRYRAQLWNLRNFGHA